MRSFPISVGLTNDPKTVKLVRKCGEAAFICYIRLLSYTATNRPSGDLSGMSAADIESASGWTGTAEMFARSHCEVKFLDGDDGAYSVNGWIEEFEPIRRLDVPLSLWRRLRQRVFERDNHTCVYCGSKPDKLECDHVHPLSRGGQSTMSNLVAACTPCNRAKRDKTPEEWRAQ